MLYVILPFIAICLQLLIQSLLCYFFISSRRRHTRSKRDWSSDVCSSDLPSLVVRFLSTPRFPKSPQTTVQILLPASSSDPFASLPYPSPSSFPLLRVLRRYAHIGTAVPTHY